MKKQIFLLILFLSASTVFAQKPQRFEKIKAHKTAFITNNIDLTSTEAEKFWPVYNKYEKELHQLKVVERRKLLKGIVENGGIDKLSEAEAQNISNKIETLKDDIHQLEKEKYKKLQKVLSAKKILKLHRAERDFHKELLKRLREKRKGRQ